MEKTWNCAGCTFVNAAGVDVCGVCGEENSAAAAAPLPTPDAAADAEAPEVAGLSGIWNCPGCTFANANAVRECGICSTVNPEAPPLAPEATPGRGEEEEAADGEGWTCPSCTFANAAGAARCIVCDAVSPAGADAPTTWVCPACTVENPLGSAKCGTCETARPAEVLANAPQWTCGSCTCSNAICDLVCTTCGVPAGGAARAPDVPVAREGFWICQLCTMEGPDCDILCSGCGQVRADHRFTFTGKRRGSVTGVRMAGPQAKILGLEAHVAELQRDVQVLRLQNDILAASVGEEAAEQARETAEKDYELMYAAEEEAKAAELADERTAVVKVEIPRDKLARLPHVAMRLLFEYCDGDELARIGLSSPYMSKHIDEKFVWATLLGNLGIRQNLEHAAVESLKDMYAMSAHMRLDLFPVFMAQKIETLKAMGYAAKWCQALVKEHPNADLDMASEMLQHRTGQAETMHNMGYPMTWCTAALDAAADDMPKAIQHVAERVKNAQQLENLGFDLVDSVEALLLKNNNVGDAAVCLLEASMTGQSTAEMLVEEEKRANSLGVALKNGNMTATISEVGTSWVTLFASAAFTEGVHTWGVQLDRVDVVRDLVIGVAAEGASITDRVGSDQYGYGLLGAQMQTGGVNAGVQLPYFPEQLVRYDTLFVRLDLRPGRMCLEVGLMSQDWRIEETCETVAVGLPPATYHPAFSFYPRVAQAAFTLIPNLTAARAHKRKHAPMARTDTEVAEQLQRSMWDQQ